ncbi:MAG: hypothetical protein PHC33_01670 [Candidatus Omnitrophica bacterium]|nr:hypothetical protein [Candidatus Omnitrophota bacterium]
MKKSLSYNAGIFFLCAGAVFYSSFPAHAGSGTLEILAGQKEYYPGEPVVFTIRGRIMLAKEAGGTVIKPPFSIWNEQMKRLNLRPSCAKGMSRAYNQFCRGGVVKEVEVARCPNAFFNDYGDIDEKFSWDQKSYVEVIEPCGASTVRREVKKRVPPGRYRIVACNSIQSCVEEEIIIRGKPEVSLDVDKAVYGQGEPVKITIRNNTNRVLINYDWNLPGERDYSRKGTGWGYVEKLKNGSWLKVEPLWRCGGECFARCAMGTEFFVLQPKGVDIFPGDIRYFEWDQSRLVCIPEEKYKPAGTGRYRISCTFHDTVKNEFRIFHSPEFRIQ